MMTQKSSIKETLKGPKIVILEINSENSLKIKNNRFNSHKLRKLQYQDASRQTKRIVNLQKIDFNEILKENDPVQKQFYDSPPKNHHQSSYLAYKAEQKYQKIKHQNKSAFLKNKFLQHKLSIDAKMKDDYSHRPVQTFDVSRSKRKMSMVQLGQCFSEGNEDVSVLNHSRNIYIKTSQGKRQKIDANTYMSKIKQKIQSLQERESKDNVFSLVNLWSNDEHIPIRLNQFNPDRHTLIRNIRSRSIKKDTPNLKVEDNENDCRPWTSNKSEAPQE